MKKLICIFLVVLSVSCINFNVFAEKNSIEQVYFNLPEAKINIFGDITDSDIIQAKLGEKNLSVTSSEKYNEDNSKDFVCVLVDVSGSMRQTYYDALKNSLKQFADSFDENDKFQLKTFGNKVKTLLKGGEKRKVVYKKIDSIKCNNNSTSYYNALNTTYESLKNKKGYDRKYVLVISDGENYDKGTSSQQEVYDNYATHTVPLYALCADYTSESQANGFGNIARSSGGSLVLFNNKNAVNKFNEILSEINDISVVKFDSGITKTVENGFLSIKFNSGESSLKNVYAKAKNDNSAPKVNDITFNKEDNSFTILFSEPVSNADKVSSYDIKDKSKNEYSVVQAKYISDQNDKVKLTINEKVYTGEYTFNFSRICDVSDNQNTIETPEYIKEFKANSVFVKYLIYSLYVIIPILFLLAIYLILIFAKKKKKVNKIREIFEQQVEEENIEIIKQALPDGRKISVYIETADNGVQRVNYNLRSSMIVGRTELCDLVVDDAKLSRQHFVLENINEGIAIMDLDTTNGTTVNGVPVVSKTFLKPGDKILAGLTTFIIQY